MAEVLELSERGLNFVREGRCPYCECKIRFFPRDFKDGGFATCPICHNETDSEFKKPTIEDFNLGLYCDFTIDKFIKEFSNISKQRGLIPIEEWDYIILNGVETHNHSIEAELVRLLWKGIDAQAQEEKKKKELEDSISNELGPIGNTNYPARGISYGNY